jgi:hypothetical protein
MGIKFVERNGYWYLWEIGVNYKKCLECRPVIPGFEERGSDCEEKPKGGIEGRTKRLSHVLEDFETTLDRVFKVH